MRIKPDWLNDSSVTHESVVTESSYKRHSEILDLTLGEEGRNISRHNRSMRAKGRKSYPTIYRAK